MRARLILLAAATSSLVVVAFLVPLAILVRSTAADRALTAAIAQAQQLAPTVATADGPALSAAVGRANGSGSLRFTVFLPDGTTVGPGAPRTEAVAIAATGRSITAEVDGGREVAVAVSGLADGTAVVRTFVPVQDLTAGVARSWLVLGLLGLGLLIVSVLVADLLARRLTRPLSAVASVSHRLAEGSLGARAGDDGPPEVRQVSVGLNLLAARITDLLAQERATVADISHRLRTPLTALRIDVESLTDHEIRARLVADLDAVDRTVDDVIREADRPARDGVGVACDAAAVVAARVDFWSVVAEEQARLVSVQVAAEPVPVKVAEADLSACVDALVGNVFTHTPIGTALSVTLRAVPSGGGSLIVADDGPGLPVGPILRRGASGTGSTGLGLDIVVRTATRSGGSVRVGRAGSGGAEIVVDLGPPDRPVVRSHRAPAPRR